MAEDHASINEEGEEGEEGGTAGVADYDDSSSTVIANTTTIAPEDYDDGPIEDYVVNLVVNEQPDLVNAAITDMQGKFIGPTTPFQESLNSYTTAIYDELNGNGTAISGGKRWWGWPTWKLILVGLVALCILAIILAVLFLVLGKKFKKNKRTPAAGSTTTTKAVVTKGVSPDPKYQPVPNV